MKHAKAVSPLYRNIMKYLLRGDGNIGQTFVGYTIMPSYLDVTFKLYVAILKLKLLF